MISDRRFKELVKDIIQNNSDKWFHDVCIVENDDDEYFIMFNGFDANRTWGSPLNRGHYITIKKEYLKNDIYCLEQMKNGINELLEEPEDIDFDFQKFLMENQWCTVRPFVPDVEYYRYNKVDLKNAVEHVCRKIDELIIQSKEHDREKKEKAKIRRQMKKNKEAVEKKDGTDE